MASNRRKSAAVVLALMGVAGLSLASASQLGVNSSILQAGSDTVDTCDADGVAVSYGYAYTTGAGYTATSVTVTGVECAGGTMEVAFTGDPSDEVGDEYQGTTTLAAIDVTTGVTSYTAAIDPIPADELASVAVVLTKPAA